MTIEYNDDRKWATHVETGMAVEFDHRSPYISERAYFLKLFIGGKSISFDVSYDYGTIRYQKQYPNMDPAERDLKVRKSNIFDVYINNFKPGIDYFKSVLPEFPDIFIELIFVVFSKMDSENKVSVYYRPYFYVDSGEWKIES